MLSHLSIENIAVIERAEIDFSEGFHALTGETGAGKSILIDAISAVLGERTSKELIRSGSEFAAVTAEFTDLPLAARRYLEENDLYDGEDIVVLQRTLRSSGKSACRINGRPVTAAMLKELGGMLLNIHGQHDAQALLMPERHLGYLDAVAGHDALIAEYGEVYGKIRTVIRELRKLEADEAEAARKTELYRHQIRELSDAGLKVGERELLLQRRTQIQNAERTARALEEAVGALRGNEEESGAAALLERAADALESAAAFDPEFGRTAERLRAFSAEADEIAGDLRAAADRTDFEPEELAQIEERLDLLYRLSRKYGETEEEMLRRLDETRAALAALEFSEERLRELEERRDELAEILLQKAKALTASRKKAAADFEKRVEEELRFLNMPEVRFTVSLEPVKAGPRGADQAEFLISANPGEPPKPLAKIASGGELSRIMLAIKSVLAEKDDIPTLIFDEVDAGISGRTAQKVGYKLRQIAEGRQIVCVTHLAQIAAMASNHLLIEKKVSDGRTLTTVTVLSEGQRVEELARIVGGARITELTLRSAREMLEQAKHLPV